MEKEMTSASSVTKDHGASDERKFAQLREAALRIVEGRSDALAADFMGDVLKCLQERQELLEALKDCTKFMERDLPMDIYFRARPEIAKARAAIDKHEGK